MRFLFRKKINYLPNLFLALFIIFTVLGHLRFWIPIFIIGLTLSLYWPRFYCKWICPVGSCIRMTHLYSRKKSLSHVQQQKDMAIIVTLTFIILFLFSIITKQRIGLFLYLTIFGFLYSLVLSPVYWCGSICPWGNIMKLRHFK